MDKWKATDNFRTTRELAKELERVFPGLQVVRSSSMPNRFSLTILKSGVVHRVDYTVMISQFNKVDWSRLFARIRDLGDKPERVVWDYTPEFQFSGKGLKKAWRTIKGGN